MASVVRWLPQLSGAVSTRAGCPGSNGSTMLTNGATAAVWAVLIAVAAGLAAPPPPGDAGELQPASIPASPAPHNASTASRASGRLNVPSDLANFINPSSKRQQ